MNNNTVDEIKKDYEKINEKIISTKDVKSDGKYIDKLISDVVNFDFNKINNIILIIINCIMPSTLLFFLEKRELFTGLDFAKLTIIIVAINLILLYGFVLLKNLSGSLEIYQKYFSLNFLRLKFGCINFLLKNKLNKLEDTSEILKKDVDIIHANIDKLSNMEENVLKSKENRELFKTNQQKIIYVERRREKHEKKMKKVKKYVNYLKIFMNKIDILGKVIEEKKSKYTINECFERYLQTNIAINFMLISVKTLTYVNILNVTLKDYQWTLLAVILYVIFYTIDIIKVIFIILLGIVSDIMKIIWKTLI